MTDRICLQRIAVYAYHGMMDEERIIGQRFFISLECLLDLQKAGLEDDYTQTVCYQRLALLTQNISTQKKYKLIEALAEAIAQSILKEFPQIKNVLVRVEKPSAPIPTLLDNVYVEIQRSQTR